MKHAEPHEGIHDTKEGAARNDSAGQQGPADNDGKKPGEPFTEASSSPKDDALGKAAQRPAMHRSPEARRDARIGGDVEQKPDAAAQAQADAGGAFTGDVAREAHQKSKSVEQRRAEGTLKDDFAPADDANVDGKIEALAAEVQNAVKRPGNAGRVSSTQSSDLRSKIAALKPEATKAYQKERLAGLEQRIKDATPARP